MMKRPSKVFLLGLLVPLVAFATWLVYHETRIPQNEREALNRQQLPLIKGDSYTAYGHTTPLDPVRGEVNKHLDAVNEKSSKAGCHAHLMQ